MTSTRKLWITLIALLVLSFGVLLAVGRDISNKAPPMPERVISESGDLIYTRADLDVLLIWMRVPGDTVFGIGALALTLFVALLWLHPKREREGLATVQATG